MKKKKKVLKSRNDALCVRELWLLFSQLLTVLIVGVSWYARMKLSLGGGRGCCISGSKFTVFCSWRPSICEYACGGGFVAKYGKWILLQTFLQGAASSRRALLFLHIGSGLWDMLLPLHLNWLFAWCSHHLAFLCLFFFNYNFRGHMSSASRGHCCCLFGIGCWRRPISSKVVRLPCHHVMWVYHMEAAWPCYWLAVLPTPNRRSFPGKMSGDLKFTFAPGIINRDKDQKERQDTTWWWVIAFNTYCDL